MGIRYLDRTQCPAQRYLVPVVADEMGGGGGGEGEGAAHLF